MHNCDGIITQEGGVPLVVPCRKGVVDLLKYGVNDRVSRRSTGARASRVFKFRGIN